MYNAQYINDYRESHNPRSSRNTREINWQKDLPSSWKDLAAIPISFDIFREYEVVADRTLGYDEDNEPCFCAYRYVLTGLCSDDDEILYEAPIHAESLTAWRLRDGRWLTFRNVVGNRESGTTHSFFAISESMPR